MDQAAAQVTTRWVYRLAALATFLTVIMGSAVCSTESGAACPSWPGCYAAQLTPDGTNSAIEFAHRVVAFAALVLMATAAWRGRRLADRQVRLFPLVALVAALSSAVFGMIVVLFGLPKAWGVVDVAAALAALCLTAAAAVRLETSTRRVTTATPGLSRLAWSTVAVVIVMHLLGIVVAATGSFVRCLSWPVWRIVASDEQPWVQGVRIAVGLVAVAMVGVVVVRALRVPLLRAHALVLAALLIGELVMGQLIVGQFTGEQERDIVLAAMYSILAVVILWATALLAARASAGTPTASTGLSDAAHAAREPVSR